MDNWIRSATLQIGPYKYDMDGLAFEFECPFEDSDEPPTATITVTNLSEQTRHGILRDHVVLINAGYQDDIGLIFKGRVAAMHSSHSGTEWRTQLTALALREDYLRKQVNKTYKPDTTAQDIVRDLSNLYGAEVARLELAENKTYPRGRVCVGKVKDVLREIVCGDCKSRLLTRNEQIYVTDPRDGIHMGLLLAPHTGLLLCDEDEMDPYVIEDRTAAETPAEQDEGEDLKKRTCLLNHNIGPADIVMVQSRSLNGRFMVVRGAHRGSYSGDWTTEVELRPV